MKRPAGCRRGRWWSLPRSVRKNRRAYMTWWSHEWAKVLNVGISLPNRPWFILGDTL